jgi:hypothetical protein
MTSDTSGIDEYGTLSGFEFEMVAFFPGVLRRAKLSNAFGVKG